MSPEPYLVSLTAKIYKLIPMRDDAEAGANVFIDRYIESLLMEMIGALDTYPVLRGNDKYISIVNTTQYLAHNHTAHSVWRREAFKMLHTLDCLKNSFGGDDGG